MTLNSVYKKVTRFRELPLSQWLRSADNTGDSQKNGFDYQVRLDESFLN